MVFVGYLSYNTRVMIFQNSLNITRHFAPSETMETISFNKIFVSRVEKRQENALTC